MTTVARPNPVEATPDAAATTLVSALIAGHEELARMFITASATTVIEPWIASIASNPTAWIIGSHVLESAAGRARVIVSVASPNAEPVGYLVTLLYNNGWQITAIEFA